MNRHSHHLFHPYVQAYVQAVPCRPALPPFLRLSYVPSPSLTSCEDVCSFCPLFLFLWRFVPLCMSGTPAATVHTACVCVRARATMRERTKEIGRLEKGEGAGKRSKGQMIVFSCASTRLDICALCWVNNKNLINYFYTAAKLSFKARRRQQHCPDRYSSTSKITFFMTKSVQKQGCE